MKPDPKPQLSLAALKANEIYWEAQWVKANEARRYADDEFAKNVIKQGQLLNENQTPIRSSP